MNLIFTTAENRLTFEGQDYLEAWRARFNIVESMVIHDVANYLYFAPAHRLALVDAIVCMADSEMIAFDSEMVPRYVDPLGEALCLARKIRDLPDTCAMSDGRKWRTVPIIIFCNMYGYSSAAALMGIRCHVLRVTTAVHALISVRRIVDEYHDQVLEDYKSSGLLVRVEYGRFQVGPALQRKNPDCETEHYYPPADRRNNKGWLTVRRDGQGLRRDLELFESLLNRNAPETEMHKFFEEHPAILTEARLGIPISHRPNFSQPSRAKPDFIMSPILGPHDGRVAEILELKGPSESIRTRGLHGGFSAKVHHAVDQVRDYDRYMGDPANVQEILRALGYIPKDSRLAVLIGRSSKNRADAEVLALRQRELDVKLVTYDEVFETQVNRVYADPGPYRIRSSWPD